MRNTIPLKPKRKDSLERILAAAAIVSVIAAWFIGGVINRPPQRDCTRVLVEATNCLQVDHDTYEGYMSHEDGTETLVGWARVESSTGYAGPVSTMVGVSPAGEILGVFVVEQTETPSFFARLEEKEFFAVFVGKSAASPFRLGEDVDGVTRATITSQAVVTAVREASYTLAETKVGLDVTREATPIRFGIPEITLIALYVAGYFGHQRKFKYKKALRWGTMLVGVVVLGFVYNLPLTIAHFNSLLLGYWPDWHTNIYWYLLIGGILFVATVDGKNPYCQWFCPFGAAQECLGAIGGAKVWHPGRWRNSLQWAQRGLAWLAIVLGLLLRNPGVSSYEIFGALFSFEGIGVQWIILVVILLLSLFVRRPWCGFLCPIDPITSLIAATRRWLKPTFKQWQTKILNLKTE